MKRKALFNRIISLSIVAVLFLTSSASAFADVEGEGAPAVEETVETSGEAAISDVPAAEETPASVENKEAVTPEGAETPEVTTIPDEGTPTSIGEKIGEVVDKVVDAITGDSKNPEDPDDKSADEDKKDKDDEKSEDEEDEDEEKDKDAKEEPEHDLIYTPNGDGTHTVKCSECDMEEYIESCEFDESGKCIHCGFQRLPDPILTYEDEEVIVTVRGAVPDNADLKVTPIKKEVEETKEAYDQVANKIFANTEIDTFGSIGFLAYDICFIDMETNQEVEPSGDVTVSMEYKKQVNPLGDENREKIKNVDVSLVHIKQEDAAIENISEEDKAVLELDSDKNIKKAEFTNDSFSPYVFVFTGTYNSEKINIYFNSINKDGDNLVTLQEDSNNFEITRENGRIDNVDQFKDNLDGYRFVSAGYMVDGEMIEFDNFRYRFDEEVQSGWFSTRRYYYPYVALYKGDEKVVDWIKFTNQQIIVYMFYEKDVTLSISKIATGPPASDTETLYEFGITDQNGQPVTDISYKNGNSTRRLDSEGKFSLKAGETADFSTFPDGDYKITELRVIGTGEDGYKINDFKTKIFIGSEQAAEYAPESIATREANFSVEEPKLTDIKIKNYYYTKITESQKEAIASKFVTYYQNTDDYQVQLKFKGPELVKKETSYEKESQNSIKAKDVHVIFAVDRSASMADNNRADHMQQASKIMAEIIKTKNNVNAQWKIVDFGGIVTSSDSWLSTDQFYNIVKVDSGPNAFNWSYPSNDSVNHSGRTNYEEALDSIQTIIANDTSDAQKIVIFLTDGLPTAYRGGGQSGEFYSYAYERALEAAEKVGGDAFYSIGLDFSTTTYRYNGTPRSAEWFLTNMTNTTNATVKKTSTVRGDKLVDLFRNMAGVISTDETGDEIETVVAYHAEDVLITDPLSDYVDIEDGTKIAIGIRDENVAVTEEDPNANELKTLGRGTWRNGIVDKNSGITNNHDDTSINIAEYDIYETDDNGVSHTYTVSAYYDKDSRSIKMTYPDGYELPPNYSFTVSFKVVPSETAYAEYFDNLQNNRPLYNKVGDPFTDNLTIPEEQWTSSLKEGFYSNGDAKASYEFCGNHMDDDFPHPVIQVHLKTVWKVYKTDGDGETGKRLADAEFTIQEDGRNAITGKSKTEDDKQGLIEWDGEVVAGKTYILTEKTAPFGYAKSDVKWKITLDGDNKPTVIPCTYNAEGELVEEAEYKVTPNRVGNIVTYEFYFKNIQTYNLPETGGNGIYRTTLYGIVLMLASVFLFYKNKRKTKVTCK
ncbi:SpaA isopeptide-forming pilin-related protein [Butyrivibrio fibrisolvens]|uniref:DUF7604 domain-containing protein n=1 Tax=Pseudobutyrivibrio ruminis TaxID=46206 RepID=UPI0004024B80|nr:SpaA isopeptide-forming pilin-related protein [Pseudobutyrivibrio ruminis]MDC7279420.1 SpaA isopeptide-forming pilin-related protein [Butyrivibrio fibrisolvens]